MKEIFASGPLNYCKHAAHTRW